MIQGAGRVQAIWQSDSACWIECDVTARNLPGPNITLPEFTEEAGFAVSPACVSWCGFQGRGWDLLSDRKEDAPPPNREGQGMC